MKSNLRIVEGSIDRTAGMLDLEFNGTVRTVPYCRYDEGEREHLTIFGLAVRYPTGKKVWPGTVIYWLQSGNFNTLRSTQDHNGFRHLEIVGFWSDVDTTLGPSNSGETRYRTPGRLASQHSSVTGTVVRRSES